MKAMAVIFSMMFVSSAFAANANKACDTYMEAVWGNAKPQVRIELGLKALVSVTEINLTPAQTAKIQTNVTKFISQYPKKQDDFEGLFYFACTTDLSSEEIDQIKEQLSQLEQL